MKPILKTIRNYRWIICSLIFFATTVNYLDRQVISLLKDDYLTPAFHWSESDFANINIAFMIFYAIGNLCAGWVIDKIGTKLGYALSLFIWSIASIAHACVSKTAGFLYARGVLGLSEAGNFPAAIKTIAQWFPKKERALATTIFNSGSNIGAILAPLTVPLIAYSYSWKWAFIITGSIGLIWLIFWLIIYEIPAKHKHLSKEEYNYIKSDQDEGNNQVKSENVKWIKLLTYRQTWSFMFGKFITDPIWWFFLFWLPSFLKNEYGMSKTSLILPLGIVYTITTIGSIFGGWLSGYFIKIGWPVSKARRTAMLAYAFAVIPVVTTQAFGVYSAWYAVLIIGLACAAHQAWSANLFTTVSDMFPTKAVASVVGLGGMAGALGGILIQKLAGKLFDYYKGVGHISTGYYIMFFICGLAYLVAWIIINILAPGMKQVKLED